MASRQQSPVRISLLISLCAPAAGLLISLAMAARGKSGYAGSLAIFVLGLASGAAVALAARWRRRSNPGCEVEDRNLLDAFLEHIPDNVFFKDKDSRFLRVSRAMANYIGLDDPRQAIRKTDFDIFSSEHAELARNDELEILRTGRPLAPKEEKETWPDGRESWVLTTKVPLRNSHGEIAGTMGISHNITERKLAEMRLEKLALHDSLTGLPNRVLLEDRISHAIALAARTFRTVAIMTVDLDRFENVNELYGHGTGDRLLKAVGERLTAALRESDTVARLGGDEFVLCIPLVAKTEDIERVGDKLIEALDTPFNVDGQEVHVRATIGICCYPQDGHTASALLQASTAAMYQTKRQRRGSYGFYRSALDSASRRQHRLDSDLLQALPRDQFTLQYQPLVETRTGRITGVEALLRWRHPEYGMISPNNFIPQLEEMGMMVEVGRWVLKSACRQSMHWRHTGAAPIRMAVNISSQQLYLGNIVETVKEVLHETHMDPSLLELEFTESKALDDSEMTLRIMQELKRLGVTLALDDFGTGWSSLSYLRVFPIDRIKVDQSFVRGMLTQAPAAAVVKGILGLGHNLGISCIAEGVEKEEEREFLESLGCKELQGFLFGKPMGSSDCMALLRASGASARQLEWGLEAPLRTAS